jgi:aldose 1-epimerase
MQKAPFGTADGKPVQIYTLTNKSGLEAKIMTYGATLVSLKTPDRTGKFANIVLGFDSIDNYVAGVPFYGATIGRFGNRIANGRFTLDGKEYQLPLNNGPNSLHGGAKGFDKRIWTAVPFETKQGPGLRLTYVSADGEEGYPGKLTTRVTYQLRNDNSLAIDYWAKTTAPTVINLTNHSYFNLSGDFQHSIVDELLTINADTFTPVNSTLIPTGELRPVKGTPLDFREPAVIGSRISADDEQIRFGLGYDHNWVLVQPKPGAMVPAATVSDPATGRVLEVRTTEPGVQFYTGNFQDGKPAGTGTVFPYRTGLTLETQHFPDSPNQPSFPTTVLRPGKVFTSHTVFVFKTAK